MLVKGAPSFYSVLWHVALPVISWRYVHSSLSSLHCTLTHWKCGWNFTGIFLKLIYGLISLALPVKLIISQCHRTPLMICQHWFPQQAITWANVDLDVYRHMVAPCNNEVDKTQTQLCGTFKSVKYYFGAPGFCVRKPGRDIEKNIFFSAGNIFWAAGNIFSAGNIFWAAGNIFWAAGNIFWAAGNIFSAGNIFWAAGNNFWAAGNIFPRGIFSGPRGIILPRGIISRPRGRFFAAGNIFWLRRIFWGRVGYFYISFPRGIFCFRREYFISAGNIFYLGEYSFSWGAIARFFISVDAPMLYWTNG